MFGLKGKKEELDLDSCSRFVLRCSERSNGVVCEKKGQEKERDTQRETTINPSTPSQPNPSLFFGSATTRTCSVQRAACFSLAAFGV